MVTGTVGTVAGILTAQFIGAKDMKEAWSSFDISMVFAVIISALFLFASGVFPTHILELYTRMRIL